MEKGNRLRRLLAIVLVAAMCLSFMPSISAAASEDIAKFEFTTGVGLPAKATTGVGSLDVVGATYTNQYTKKSISAGDWKENAHWLIYDLDTSGYTDLTFSADMRSSKTGPANFVLEYSTDGSSWKEVPDGRKTIASEELKTVYSNVALPAEASSKTLSLRLRMADNTSENGKTVASAGNSNINNVVISGTASGGTTTPDPDPTEPSTEPTVPSGDVSTIRQALDASEGTFTVKGVVTMVDRRNIYLQDETGGICAYFDTAPSDVKLGDTVTFTGTRATFSGLPELTGSDYTKSSDLKLTAKAVSAISELTNADVCTYVELKGLEVTEVYDNSGAYSNPNIKVRDASGTEIQIYRAVVSKTSGAWDIQVGDKLDVKAAVGINNSTLQLRNTLATELVVTSEGEGGGGGDVEPSGDVWTKVTENQDDWSGTYLVVYEASATEAYVFDGTDAAGDYITVPLSGDTVSTDGTYAVTIEKVENGYTMRMGDKYIYTTTTGNALKVAADQTTATANPLTIAAVDGTVTIQSYTKETRLQFYKSGNDSRFRFYSKDHQPIALYKQSGEGGGTTTQEIKDGTYVIWNPEYNMALSSTYGTYYNNGKSVTLEGDTLTGYTAAEIWTVKKEASGNYSISYNGKKLGVDSSKTSMPLGGGVNEEWKLMPQDDGTYYIYNVSRNAYMEWYKDKTYWSAYYSIGDEALFKQKLTPVEPVEVEEAYKPVNGDRVVIFNSGSGLVMTGTASGTRLNGAAATASGSKLFADGSELYLNVTEENGVYTFTTESGKVLNTSANGGSLTLVEKDSAEAATWELVQANGGWYLKSATAKWSSGSDVYVEYYSGFTTYYSGTTDIYLMKFYKDSDVRHAYETDPDVVDNIAQWGGGGPYSDAQNEKVPGDLYTVGDMLDSNASFTVRAQGKDAQPYQKTSTNTGGYNYYMGGENIGASAGDYMQLALSTAGYGDMTMSFRLRVTGAGAKEYTLRYSTDGGDTWDDFETGAYEYQYYSYSESDPGNKSGSGKITDGKAFGFGDGKQYVTFTFDVPMGAENAEKLLIRLVPGTEKLNGNGGTIAGNVRFENVVISGSPIINEDGVVGYVSVAPDGQEEDVIKGTELTMASATTGAEIHYRFVDPATGEPVDGKDWAVYSDTEKPKLVNKLPAVLEVYAEKDGVKSITRRFRYNAGTVAAVQMDPNGGGVYLGTDGSAKITLTTKTEGATIWYRTDKMEVGDEGMIPFTEYKEPIELKTGFGSLKVEAYATLDGLADSPVTTRTFTERSKAKYDLYFGQFHSHTSYSDGAGTAEEAYAWVKNLGPEYNMDFLSVTDHSNSFDGAGSTLTINDVPNSTEWAEGKQLAAAATDKNFVGIFGYEMTWSNGLGHINTYNTTGFQDRTQSDYTSYSNSLQNYYAMLKTASDSISQFNHPGTTFGDFSDFAYYDEQIDQLITMIEVGNGEGAIGSSGYFPSYEYYTRALDKGWHVAPTNNQDNHKGGWGSANTGRNVVLVDELTEQSIYDAIRNYRLYATEDLNLEIYYTFDGNIMGTILESDSYGKDDKAKIVVELNDPDDKGDAKVEVIVNGGLTAATATASAKDTVTFDVPTNYNYYYIRITQADGDIAVTAPVWVGKVEAVGITSLTAEDSLTIAGESQRFNLELYNNESKALDVNSITFTVKETGETIPYTCDISTVRKLSTASTSFNFTFKTDGIYTIVATVKGTMNDMEKTYTQNLEVTVMPTNIVSHIIVDGTHYNDYVSGYYGKDPAGGNMTNMQEIASDNAVKVQIVFDKITPDMLKNCSVLVLTAPCRKVSSGNSDTPGMQVSAYEDEFLTMVSDYVKNGGCVIVTGLADYQDMNAAADHHTSYQQNRLLEAIGSSMRINDDEAVDDVNHGDKNFRLYPATYNTENAVAATWLNGIVEGQTYSQYSGCTVDISKGGTWLVKGFDTTYSIDSDNDGKGGVDKGEAYFLAYEEVGAGKVFAAGGVFLSDFEVKAELDNIWDLPYANRTIYENILHTLCAPSVITPISDTRKAELNKVFVIEGYVTSGTTNENTTFFDAIYVQDASGGTTCFPYSTAGLAVGTKVRILGYTDAYQDDREIQIISLTVLNDAPHVYEPKKLTTEQAADYGKFGGQLVQTSGKVSRIVMASGRVSQFDLTDSTGVTATVFIDGYIWNEKGEDPVTGQLKNGQTVSAIGLLYKHPEGDSTESVPVLRVRNCDEIKIISSSTPGTVTPPTGDNAQLELWVTAMALTAAAVVTLLALRKKVIR